MVICGRLIVKLNATVKKLNHSVKPDMMLVGKKLTHMEGFSYGSY